MKDKVKIFWASMGTGSGNLFGYSTHNTNMVEYVRKTGRAEISSDPKSDIAVYITSPGNFHERPPIPPVLFTMWEGTDLPGTYHDELKQADYLFTPSTYVQDLFSKYFDPTKIYTIQEGVKFDFKYKERKSHPKHFRYLWVGAPNPRKGFEELTAIWEKLGLAKYPNIELYLKTSGLKKPRIEKNQNIIIDSRSIPVWELVQLYHSAHCFVWPTRGEGFGLCLAEAMATGLPCVCTYATGVTDFFDDEVGYPVMKTYKKTMDFFAFPGGPKIAETTLILPDATEVAQKMIEVYENYPKALIKGKKASIRIKSKFTWERSAEIFMNAIDDILRREREQRQCNNREFIHIQPNVRIDVDQHPEL